MTSALSRVVAGIPFGLTDLDAATTAASTELDTQGIEAEAQAGWLSDALEQWRSDIKSPEIKLRRVVSAAVLAGTDFSLEVPDSVREALSHSGVKKIVETLAIDHSLGWDGAAALLGRLPLIVQLAHGAHFSASRISTVLGADGSNVPTSWRPIQGLLQTLGITPNIKLEVIQLVIDDDKLAYEELFPDSDLLSAAETIDRFAVQCGIPEGALGDCLVILSSPDRETESGPVIDKWQYVQILHYQCAVGNFYDHPLAHAYEFSPRGESFAPIEACYEGVSTAANPVLNNAKSIDVFDDAWARSRGRAKDDKVKPLALVRLFDLVDALPWASRRHLCAALRQWCLLVIDTYRGADSLIDVEVTPELIKHVADQLMLGSSGTKGVIEQRFVDAIVNHIYDTEERVVLRGLGAAVEEPNYPHRRLGDVDVQNTDDRTVVGFEPTGGALRSGYMHLHKRTLKRSLASRVSREWDAIDPDASHWSVTVRFVASSIEAGAEGMDGGDEFGGVKVSFEATTFASLLDEALAKGDEPGLMASYATWVHGVLNGERTRSKYRAAYLALLQAGQAPPPVQ